MNSISKFYRFHSFYIEFIGFTHGIPRYITDRQNNIGFTYKSAITYPYLFTVSLYVSRLATMLSLGSINIRDTILFPFVLHTLKSQAVDCPG